MKKVLFVFVLFLAGIFTYGYGQDVRVNINNQDYSSNDCEFKINGICSSEDIGGVDVQFRTIVNENGFYYSYTLFTNYNSFPVTTLCKVVFKCPETTHEEKTYNVILGVNGSKEVAFGIGHGDCLSVEGMIVRKLAQ